MNYLYYFKNYNDEIIYVGKTGNIKRRIKEHFTKGHLPNECYQQVKSIYYTKVNESKYDTEICETLLINEHKPIFNVEKKFNENKHKTTYSLLELKFERIYFNFMTNETTFSEPKPACFTEYHQRDKCKALLEYNEKIIKKQSGLLEYCLSDILMATNDFIVDLEELLNNAKKTLKIDFSNLDEPVTINENFNDTYIAFDINILKNTKISLNNLFIFNECGFIFRITKDIYGIPLFSEKLLINMNNNFKKI